MLLRYYQYKLFPDSISYLTISQKYLSGDFSGAINAYWPPLFSWLLVPFQWCGFSPLVSVKLLHLFVGFFTIIGTNRLSYRFDLPEKIRVMVLLTLIPIVLQFSLTFITPDFLLVCLLVYYFAIIFQEDYPKRTKAGVLCGVLGGVAYLCKTYSFPFFIIHFPALNLMHFLKCNAVDEKKRTVRSFLSGMVAFSMVSGIWIGIISIKSQELTIGTTVKYNLALTGPNKTHLSRGTKDFVSPPNKTAVAAWENPAAYEIQSWSPWQSWNNFKHEVKHVSDNFYYLTITFLGFSLLSVSIVLAYIIWCIPIRLWKPRTSVIFPLFTVILYSSGYLFLWVNTNERYFWIAEILLLLMGARLLHIIFCNLASSGQKLMASIVFAFSFISTPSLVLARGFDEGKEIYELSQQLKSQYKIEGNIASFSKYRAPLYLSYHLNCQYHGKIKKGLSDQEFQSRLLNHKINYFFLFGKSFNNRHQIPKFLHTQTELTKGQIPNLKIYAINLGNSDGS